jgi:hypothetical protein
VTFVSRVSPRSMPRAPFSCRTHSTQETTRGSRIVSPSLAEQASLRWRTDRR